MQKRRKVRDPLRIVARLVVTCFDLDWPGNLVQAFLRQSLEAHSLKVERPSQTLLHFSLYDYLGKICDRRSTLGDSDVGMLANFIYRRRDNPPSVRFGQRDFRRCRDVFLIEHELQLGRINNLLLNGVFSTGKRLFDFILALAFEVERPHFHFGDFNGIKYAHSYCVRSLIGQVATNALG